MSLRLGPHPILCRPARPADRDQVFSFLAEIWDGGDYLPQVWDRWLEDPAGILVAAERGGVVVGLGRLVDLGEGEAWMEGLRVAPRLQRQGIGFDIHRFLLERWMQSPSRVVRLATHASRTVVRAMCDRTGFELEVALHHHRAEAEPGEHGLAALPVDRAATGVDVIRQGSISRSMAGLMELDWQWASLTAERVEKSAARGEAWSRGEGREVLITSEVSAEGEPGMRLQAVGADSVSAAEILRASRRLAFGEGLPSVRWLAPEDAGIEAALQQAGFSRAEEDPLLIYARAR